MNGLDQMKHAIAALILTISAGAALASPESEISAYRKAYGLSAVAADSALNALAAKQAQAMAASGTMDHSVYAPFAQRISAYGTAAAAENIAMGTRTFSETLAIWKASSGHNANLLMGDARLIGIASATGHGRTYWALILAAPHDSRRHKGGFLQAASAGGKADDAGRRSENRGTKTACSRDADGMWQKLVCWLNGS
jgi:Cysteine-rich secretory protein family